MISIFHAAEISDQGKEQGRDGMQNGDSYVLATAIAGQDAESQSLASSHPSQNMPSSTSPAPSQS